MFAAIFNDPAFNQGLIESQKRLYTTLDEDQVAAKRRLQQLTVIQRGAASNLEPEGKERQPRSATPFSAEQQQQLSQLQSTDRQVKAHEQAHLSAAGPIAVSAARFEYITGPDGERYAVAGEVSIDASEVAGDPQATITKAGQIRTAALAPADPSAQDQLVASRATQMAQKARLELSRQQSQSSNATLPSAESRPHRRTRRGDPLPLPPYLIDQIRQYRQPRADLSGLLLHASA